MGPGLRQEAVFVHLLVLTPLIPGKWVYEVLISSQGLMQIGWCTINCRFNQEVHVERAPPREACCCCRSHWDSGNLPDHTKSAQDPHPDCLLEGECIPLHARASHPRKSLSPRASAPFSRAVWVQG